MILRRVIFSQENSLHTVNDVKPDLFQKLTLQKFSIPEHWGSLSFSQHSGSDVKLKAWAIQRDLFQLQKITIMKVVFTQLKKIKLYREAGTSSLQHHFLLDHPIMQGLLVKRSNNYSSVADPGCLPRIPDLGSKRFRIPDPDLHQRISVVT
jgi:hypothetical protein